MNTRQRMLLASLALLLAVASIAIYTASAQEAAKPSFTFSSIKAVAVKHLNGTSTKLPAQLNLTFTVTDRFRSIITFTVQGILDINGTTYQVTSGWGIAHLKAKHLLIELYASSGGEELHMLARGKAVAGGGELYFILRGAAKAEGYWYSIFAILQRT